MMFFRKLKILKSELKQKEAYRTDLESHIFDIDDTQIDGDWLEYFFIGATYSLEHNGGRGSIRNRIELEREKINFFWDNHKDAYIEYNRFLEREKAINDILNES